MARSGRQLAKPHRPQHPAERLTRDADPELLPHPLAQIDQPPAHDAVHRRDWTTLDHGCQRRTLRRVEKRRLAGRFPIDQTGRTVGVEAQDPVTNDLQRHPADLRRLRPTRPVVDCRQRQQTPRLSAIAAAPRRHPQSRRIKIRPKPNRHGEPPPFAILNHNRPASGKLTNESASPSVGITSRRVHRAHREATSQPLSRGDVCSNSATTSAISQGERSRHGCPPCRRRLLTSSIPGPCGRWGMP